MKQRGKQSQAGLGVVNITGKSRMIAPDHLNNDLKNIWIEIVNSKPADFFGREHSPMLETLCRHIIQERTIGEMLDNFKPEWALEDDGLKRLEKLQTMHAKQSGCISVLMRSMRLTHQAIYRANKAPDIVSHSTTKPWEFE